MEKLHKKYGWFKCRFHPFDIYELDAKGDKIKCRWCGKEYKTEGYPYLDCKLTPLKE
jgi:hypothetical protein